MKSWGRRIASLVGIVVIVKAMSASHHIADQSGGPDYAVLATGMMGGLAIFLFGMDKMGDALKHVAGNRLKMILGRLTDNRFLGLLTGAFVTAVIQSSSVTTVMLVGFITAGLMTLPQAIGVILGADIGTTITAQLIAFKITRYSLLMIAVGFGLIHLSKRDETQQYGHMIMGMGFIFFGMGVMSEQMKPLRDSEMFVSLMGRMNTPWLAVLVAAIFTALIQASAATMGVIIVLASQGLITLEGGIALALGANIGTCATAALACIGKPREAIRAALAHVLFKIIGVAIALPLIKYLAMLVVLISPRADPSLSGLAAQAAVVPRQIANAHTIFNCTIAFVFLPFSNLFAKLLMILVPDRPAAPEDEAVVKPRYLDPSVIDTPVLALGLVRREVSRIGDRLEQMLAGVPQAVFEGDLEKATEIRDLDDEVDALYQAITEYLSEVGQEIIVGDIADEIMVAITAANELESIGDIIENNLTHLAELRAERDIELDAEVQTALLEFHEQVSRAVRSALGAFVSDNREAAAIVSSMKDKISGMDAEIRLKQSRWLREGVGPERMAAYTLEMDILENLKRIYYHAKRVAKLVLHEEGAASWTVSEAA